MCRRRRPEGRWPPPSLYSSQNTLGTLCLKREIDATWIERTVRELEWSRPDPNRPGVERRFRSIPEYGNRVLRVACRETEHEVRIVTMFFDRDARKQR